MNSINDLNTFSDIPESELLDMIYKVEYEDKTFDKTQTDEYDINTNNSDIGVGECKCKCTDNFVNDRPKGVIVCVKCGDIVSIILDESAEWRSYDNVSGSSAVERCSSMVNPHLPKSSIGTSISGRFMSRIKMLNEWGAMPYEERSLNIVLKLIQRKCRQAKILKCIEDDAKIMYKYINNGVHDGGKNAGKKMISRGVNRTGLIAACVFFACIRKGRPRNISEIAQLFDIDYTEMTNGLKIFKKRIRMSTSTNNTIEFKIGSSEPKHFIRRYCKRLKLPNEYIDRAIIIAENVKKLNMASRHTPISITVGIIWLIIESESFPMTKKKLSKEFKISEVTITKTYNIIKPRQKILESTEMTSKILNILKKERANVKMPLKYQLHHELLKSNINTDIDEYCEKINELIGNDEIYNISDQKYNKLELENMA